MGGASGKSAKSDAPPTPPPTGTKLLFLGPQRSGKTTFTHQVRSHVISTSNGSKETLSIEEINNRRRCIRYALAAAMDRAVGILPDDTILDDPILDAFSKHKWLKDDENREIMIKGWALPTLKNAVGSLIQWNPSESWLRVLAARADAILESEYEPSEDDIIRIYWPSKGANEWKFIYGDENYSIHEPKSRGERRTWLKSFEEVGVLVYFVDLTGYSRLLPEDESISWMADSYQIFTDSATSKWFSDVPICLFFSHMDEFPVGPSDSNLAAGVSPPTLSLKNTFPDYTLNDSATDQLAFIMSKFSDPFLFPNNNPVLCLTLNLLDQGQCANAFREILHFHQNNPRPSSSANS